MKKVYLAIITFILSSCTQDMYTLKINNNLGDEHGQSIYFRSSLRSYYAGQIRRSLSNKFSEIGMMTATNAEDSDFIAIFDVETFYKPSGEYKNISLSNTLSDSALFTTEEDARALNFSGNGNVRVDKDKTCFTLNIGRKNTSNITYSSMFCANTITETQQMIPLVLDVYSKFATYKTADMGIQCLTSQDESVSCQPATDKQQMFINSLWVESSIK